MGWIPFLFFPFPFLGKRLLAVWAFLFVPEKEGANG